MEYFTSSLITKEEQENIYNQIAQNMQNLDGFITVQERFDRFIRSLERLILDGYFTPKCVADREQFLKDMEAR